MIISRGWGVLAFLIPITIILLGISFFGKNGNATLSILFYSLIIAGTLTFLLGLIFKKKSIKKHDLYFLPLQIWGVIWLIIGIIGAIYA